MPPDANSKPDTDAMDDDGELTVEALDRVVGGAVTSNTPSNKTYGNSSHGGRPWGPAGPMNLAAP